METILGALAANCSLLGEFFFYESDLIAAIFK